MAAIVDEELGFEADIWDNEENSQNNKYLLFDMGVEMYDIPDSDIDLTPTFQSRSADAKYVSGLAKVDDRAAIFIDAHQLLHMTELASLTTAE